MPKFLCMFILLIFSCEYLLGCQQPASAQKGAKTTMERYYLGRFSLRVPATMLQKLRSSSIRCVEIEEISWPLNSDRERAHNVEWDSFMKHTQQIAVPIKAKSVVIDTNNFPGIGKWTRGIFYYDGNHSYRTGQWKVLMDSGSSGIWFTGDLSLVEEENASHVMAKNLENLANSYHAIDLKTLTGLQPDHRFYLQKGFISLPYLEQESSIARFEGHPLQLSLLIEMEMDIEDQIDTSSLIDETRAMLAAALVIPGGGMSKIRLRKREVAGMPGEESVLRVREGDRKDLVFTWQFNGREDSGEYPTTRIEMESPDGHLSEKLEIWDAILDSMKPMFVRKKS